jgi:phosphatidylserine/phosphatidylglycerophosphate/cardiolipin synthase-like enzyme
MLLRWLFTGYLLVIVSAHSSADEAIHQNYLFGSGENGERRITFTLPECLPACTPEHRSQLTAGGIIEQQIIAAITSAKHEISFSQFTFSRQPIFEALVSAAERGVRIRGVMDSGQFQSIRSYCNATGCEFPAPFNSAEYQSSNIAERRRQAAEAPLFKAASNSEKLALLLHRTNSGSEVKSVGGRDRLVHHKFVLMDQARLVSGSGNWSSTAVSINLENLLVFDAETEPERVKAFACMFEAGWGDSSRRAQRTGECQTSEVFFAPVARGQASIVEQITAAIGEAQAAIDIAMHHLVHPAVIFELTRAAQRGVRVRISTDDDACMSQLSPEMSALVQAGAETRYVPTSCQMFQLAHNKFGIFDQRKVINGSGNWSKAGLERNFENFLVTTDDQDVAPFVQAFEKIWSVAQTKEDCTCNPAEATCKQRYCFGERR